MEFTEKSESSSLVHLIRRHFPPTIQHSPQPGGAGEETNLNYCLEFIALIIRVTIFVFYSIFYSLRKGERKICHI